MGTRAIGKSIYTGEFILHNLLPNFTQKYIIMVIFILFWKTQLISKKHTNTKTSEVPVIWSPALILTRNSTASFVGCFLIFREPQALISKWCQVMVLRCITRPKLKCFFVLSAYLTGNIFLLSGYCKRWQTQVCGQWKQGCDSITHSREGSIWSWYKHI